MKNTFNIFFVSAEVAPFVEKGNLASTSGSLPKALKDLGHDIRMMMPNYRFVNERKYVLRDVIRLKDMSISFANEAHQASGKSAFLPDSKVQIYFLDYKPYFDRLHIYKDPKAKKPYQDNAERFFFFAIGCLETLKLLHWQPDIIHCNDWQTAIIPFLLKTIYKDDSFFKNTRALLTIHNLEDQGVFSTKSLDSLTIPDMQYYPGSQIELNGTFNFLKAGLLSADLINFIGEDYAKEIQRSSEPVFGLEDVLQKRRRALSGVENGIDTNVWNPETDTQLENQYLATSLSGKKDNKKEFCETAGLTEVEDLPLLVVTVSSDQINSFEKTEKLFTDLLGLGARIVVLGELNTKARRALNKTMKAHKGQIILHDDLDDKFLHNALAAADLLFEFTGEEESALTPLHALKYGTLPAVFTDSRYSHAIQDIESKPTAATGFVIADVKIRAITKKISDAIHLYEDKKRWAKLVKNAMKQDHSWHTIGEKYTKLYSNISGRNKK